MYIYKIYILRNFTGFWNLGNPVWIRALYMRHRTLKKFSIELKGKPRQSSVNRLLNNPSIVNPLPLKDIMEVDSL